MLQLALLEAGGGLEDAALGDLLEVLGHLGSLCSQSRRVVIPSGKELQPSRSLDRFEN